MPDPLDIMIHSVPSEKTVAVQTTSAILVEQSLTRTSLIIQNVGANPIWVSQKNPAASGQGIRLSKQDTAGLNALILNVRDHGRLVRGPWYAIAETAATNCTVEESSYSGGPL